MHIHISGVQAFITFLYMVVLFGTANLLALRFKDRSTLAMSWANLFGLV